MLLIWQDQKIHFLLHARHEARYFNVKYSIHQETSVQRRMCACVCVCVHLHMVVRENVDSSVWCSKKKTIYTMFLSRLKNGGDIF